jgi:hypothetical protein
VAAQRPDRVALAPWSPPLVALFFFIHVAEEATLGFPAWATRHFGTTSNAWFAISHVPLIAWMLVLATRGHAARGRAFWSFAVVATQMTVFSNGLFHLATTFLFREYSPGLVTAVLLHLPFGMWMARHAASPERLGVRFTTLAAVTGFVAHAVVIASLYLDVTFV